MDLKKLLGFSLEPVRIDPDGASSPPEVSALAPPSEPRAAPLQPALDATRIEGLAPPPPPFRAHPGSEPTAAATTAAATAALAHAAKPITASAPRRRRHLAALAAASMIVGFTSAAIWSRAQRRAIGQLGGAPESPGASANGSPGASTPGWQDSIETSTASCALQREAQRIATGISPTFALEGSSLGGGIEVLVGAASASNAAVGLELNATTLRSRELLRDDAPRELLGVVPATSTEPGMFAVDRAGVGGYRDWRTLPNQATLALGRTNHGIHLVRRGEPRSVALWPLDAAEEISRPRVERQDHDRLAIALRRGGRHGTLVIGWLDHANLQRSALRDLPLAGRELGLPSLAIQGRRAAVAAAVRASAGAPWRIQIATSEWNGQTLRVALPELHSQADQDTFAPSLVRVDEARWLLQWTEGQQGQRHVRAITLSADFMPLGEPIDVSTAGANAGGGLVVPVDQGLLSLFLVQRDAAYELWATTLSCT